MSAFVQALFVEAPGHALNVPSPKSDTAWESLPPSLFMSICFSPSVLPDPVLI